MPIGFADKRAVKFYFATYRTTSVGAFLRAPIVTGSRVASNEMREWVRERERGGRGWLDLELRLRAAMRPRMWRAQRERETAAVAGTFLDYPYLRKFRARYAR